MIIRIILAIACIILLFWLSNQWRKLPTNKRKGFAVKSILVAAGILVALAVVSGRMHWFGAVFAGLLALGRFGFLTILRALPFLKILRSSPLVSNPRFKTPYLDVCIDLKNIQIFGTVIAGPHSGKEISQLDDSDLDELERFYESNNKASLYLIRVIRQKPNTSKQQKDFPSTGNPSVEEAFQVLGLKPEATKKEVIKAHRSLMQKLHPDRGGNDYLASRVNLAKDILTQHFDQKENT